MRVLRIADVARDRAGGVARFMIASGDALARRGVDVDMLFSEDLAGTTAPAALRRIMVPWLVAWRVVTRACGPRRPDVVEIHEPLAAPYAVLSRLACGRLPRCVVMSHGLEERGWAAQRDRWRRTGGHALLRSRISVPLTLVGPARIALRWASRAIVLSTADVEFLTTQRRIAPARVVRVNGGMDVALLRADRTVAPAPRMLFVGSWIDRKGVPELCAAWCRLSELHTGLRMTIAGTGVPHERVLHDLLPACRDGVTVVPFVDDDQLLELLTSHDIFVLPSWFEGMPLSMIEAAAAGTACVVSSICGNVDFFRAADPMADGALLIPPHSADALVDAVDALAGDADLRARLGQAARRRAAGFTWDHTADGLLAAYGFATAPPSAELDISVLVASWRRPEDLRRCLAALGAQTRPATEVVVVARRHDHPTRAVVESAPPGRARLRIVDVDVPGVVEALNVGLDAAHGAIIAITDDDAAPRPDWLEGIHEHLRARPDVAAVGGRDWLHPDEVGAVDEPEVGRLRAYGRLVGNHHHGGGGARDVDVLKGVNLAVRRSALGDLRLDERLRGGGAQAHWELGLCLALRRGGWRLVYDPEVAVDHYPAQRFDASERAYPPTPALADEVHNETYALLRWLPWWRGVGVFAYGVIVGSRRAPGFLVAAERILRSDRHDVGERLMAAQRARLVALRTVREQRADDRSQ